LGADDVVELQVVGRAQDGRDVVGDLSPDAVGALAAEEVYRSVVERILPSWLVGREHAGCLEQCVLSICRAAGPLDEFPSGFLVLALLGDGHERAAPVVVAFGGVNHAPLTNRLWVVAGQTALH